LWSSEGIYVAYLTITANARGKMPRDGVLYHLKKSFVAIRRTDLETMKKLDWKTRKIARQQDRVE
jgi:hypothetical protein